MNFDKQIEPFLWIEHNDGNPSVILYKSNNYKASMFMLRKNEGFTGSGDDWTELAKNFIKQSLPDLKSVIKFDPEDGMFCAYSSDTHALKKFVLKFKETCEDDTLINFYFSRINPRQQVSVEDIMSILKKMQG